MTFNWLVVLIVVLVCAIIVFKLIQIIARRKLCKAQKSTPDQEQREGAQRGQTLGKNPLEEKKVIAGDSKFEKKKVVADDSKIEKKKVVADDSKIEKKKIFADDSKFEKEKVVADDSKIEKKKIFADDSKFEKEKVIAEDSKTELQNQQEKKQNHFLRRDNKDSMKAEENRSAESREIFDNKKRVDSPVLSSDTVLGLTNAVTPSPSPEKKKISAVAPTNFIAIYLKAEKDRPYAGYELLQTLLTAGLRYGKKNIFHRYEQKGQEDILFSVASAEEPGTFDLTNIGSFSTIGLSLFFKVSAVKDPLKSYDALLKTLAEVAEELGGEILDARYQKLTQKRILETRASLKESSRLMKLAE